MTDRCPHCGAMIMATEKFCAQCGQPLYGAQSAWQPGTTPATISQLSACCTYHGMPLEKMRFFIGQDYRQPRAFGIYQDGDQFIVYKNKDDGSRAVRYHGPDEAYAVNELYTKLLDECHKRNIWPGGKPQEQVEREKKARRRLTALVVATVLVIAVASFFVIRSDRRAHAHDGYYRFDDAGLYYLYGSTWYYDDYYDDYDWVVMDDMAYGDGYSSYYIGDAYDQSWGTSDFEQSSAWQQIQDENRTSSSDYDSWDSGGTDWSSDW